ncbi:MAG: S8 family serine peptidase [Armatimonadetes bacterium]|nr:S8 family serine peptidase [Anaerolineae bacterium]
MKVLQTHTKLGRRVGVLVLFVGVLALLLSVGASAAPVARKASPNYISPEIGALLKAQGSVRVIVNLNVTSTIRSAGYKNDIAFAQNGVLAALPAGSFTVTAQFKNIPALSGTVTAAGLNALLFNPAVKSINLDKEVNFFGNTAAPVRDAESDLLTRAGELNALGYTGEGSRVGVVDTGIDTDHPSTPLLEDIFHQRCFRTEGDCVGGETSAEDVHGHGTHVSGIITGLYGVAPDAEVAALKVFTTGSTSDTNILNALDYAADNDATLQLDAINMSLSGGSYPDQASCDADNGGYVAAFATVNALGITMFVSTGNGYSVTTVGSPGCVTGAIGVGSVDDAVGVWDDRSAPDVVTSFSNATPVQGVGELVDILSTGCAILSEVPPTIYPDDFADFCGTSMSSPTAAGVAAALLEFDPSLTPSVIEELLETSGDLVVDDRAGMNNQQFPRVDAMNAYGALLVDAPTNLTVTVFSPTQLDLDWTGVDGETGYVIERSADGISFAEVGTTGVDVVEYSDTTAPCGEVFYRVRASTGSGNSLPSNTASATGRTCPAAPSNLTASGISDTQVDLAWTDNATDEDNTRVERSNDGGATWTEIATVVGVAYSDTTALCGVNVYRVRAFRASDSSYSPYSNTASAVLCGPDNDAWSNAEVISSETYNDIEPEFPSATFEATDPIFSCHVSGPSQGAESIWYEFIPTSNGEVSVDTIGSTADGTNPDTLLGIYTGTPGAFTEVACSDDLEDGSGDYVSQITDAPVTAGVTYYIIAANWSFGSANNINEMYVNFTFVGDGSATITPTETFLPPTETSVPPTETPVPTATATEEVGVNMMLNSNIETASSLDPKMPDGWSGKNLTSDRMVCNKTGKPPVAYSGLCALRFKGSVGENSSMYQKPDATALVAGDTLNLSVFVNTTVPAAGKVATVKVKYVDLTAGANNDGKDKLEVSLSAATTEYTEFTGVLTVDGTVAKLKISVGFSGESGKLYIDDVIVMHMPGARLMGRGLLPMPGANKMGGNN